MLIRDVLGEPSRDVVIAETRATIADVVDLLEFHSIGAVVVSDDGSTIDGIISERDIVRHLAAEQEGTLRLKVEDLMTEAVITCALDDDVEATMGVMTSRRFRHMPVADDGSLVGIVSLGDLVTARLRELETMARRDGTT